MRMTKLVFALVLLAAGAAGFGLGRQTAPRPEPTRAVALAALEPGSAAQRVAEALAIPGELERSEALIRLLRELGPEHIPVVEDVVDDAWLMPVDPAWSLLAEWEVQLDPAAALERASEWEHPEWGQRAVARAWARRDPEAARKAIEPLDNPTLTLAVMRGWFESGQIEEAWDYVENELPAGAERQRSVAVLISRMLLSDGIDATVAWAEAIPDDAPRRFKLQVFRRLSRQLARLDPPFAAAFAERYVDAPIGRQGQRLNLFEHVAVQWVRADPVGAMEWLESLPPSGERDRAVGQAYRNWLRTDLDAAVAWADAKDAPAWLDPAVAAIAAYVSVEDPAEGIRWAERIDGEERRNQVTVIIGQRWLSKDREAAEAWLASVSPQLREQIRPSQGGQGGRGERGGQG